MATDEDLRRKAKLRAEAKIGFYIHFGVYLVVNILLFFVWWFTRGYNIPGASFPWFIFPFVGWGIGLVAHYLAVFSNTGIIDRMAEQEYRKLKDEQD